MKASTDFEYDYTGTDAHRAKSVDRARKIWVDQGVLDLVAAFARSLPCAARLSEETPSE